MLWCEVLDHGAGKGRTSFEQALLLDDSDILCMRLPSVKACYGWKRQKPEIFSRGKVLPHFKQCKNKTSLVFTVDSLGPSIGLCNMDVWCLLLECLSIQCSEDRIIIMKFQTITLIQGYKYNLISQGDHLEDIQMFTLQFVSDLYFLEVRASLPPTLTSMWS